MIRYAAIPSAAFRRNRTTDEPAAASSLSRRLPAISSFYSYCATHDLITGNPVTRVKRPTVDPDHTATVGLSREETRAVVAAADAGPERLRTRAVVRLLLHNGLRVDELAAIDEDDLGHDRGHRIVRKRC